jgi:acetolactate synthase-1/2/3 large subunit
VQDKVVEVRSPEGAPLQGEIGEIVVKSSFLASGYWNDQYETEIAFKPTPNAGEALYRTGDLGFFDQQGQLHYVGRQDDQVKVRGFRLNCREVEAALLQLEGVKEAAVLVDRSGREPELVARVHMSQGRPCLQSLRKQLQKLLPEWKIPTRVSTVEPLPKTLTGKIDKTAIRRSSPPEIEKELEMLWLSLERPPVSAQDDLLLFGGDSITIVLLLHEIEQKFQVAITPREFFEKRTLEHLATLVNQRREEEPETPLKLETEPVFDAPSSDLDEWTVADGFLALLNDFGIRYLFLNPGTDSAPLLESIARFKQRGLPAPEVVLCLHESVAMSCAHGYFMVSGQPQTVFVHVDLGTLNVGGSLHNAQRGRAGIVLVAGRSPYTLEGQAASRDRYAHWIQEQRDQTGAVRNYVKWDYTLPCPQNLVPALEKAFQTAASSPEGPVYLTLPREVFMAALDRKPRRSRLTSRSRKTPDPELLLEIATRILTARFPLFLVSRSGSDPETVSHLVELSDLAAIAVVESRHRLNFPHSHPHHLGFSPNQFLNDADLVVVLDHDVPWIPKQWQPTEGCCIVQVDCDTQKLSIPIWGFPVDISMEAEPLSFLTALVGEVRGKLKPHHQETLQRRRRQLSEIHQTLRQRWERAAITRSNESPVAPPWFGYCLNQLMDEKTTVVCDAATNNPVLWSYLQTDHPASFFQSLGSSLGWGLSAAVGAKMATPDRTVIAVVGDGGWMFSNPLVVYQLAQRQNAPFLTIVLNNEKYAAISEAVQSLAPEGEARRSRDFPACELPGPGYYTRIGAAAGLWARAVRQPDELQETLRQALGQVRQGKGALVEIWVSSPNP